ncbi:MAG: PilZ domain-containing protein [Bdellovibrionaceae bacterium]|nr:PilZ domain-containing protein [Pseudobdellovibrionaceae bacterium]
MTHSLAKYHARSPRYILNTHDDSLVRVAGPQQIPWEEDTEIKNVSLTGLAFTAPEDLCPVLGEVIKVQFVVPGAQQMACHAIVTRLEPDRQHSILVAVHFYKLEMAHRIVLAQGLSRKVKNEDSDFGSLTSEEIKTWNFFKKVFIMGFLATFWVIVMNLFMDGQILSIFDSIHALLIK